jgi:hypothetical protein
MVDRKVHARLVRTRRVHFVVPPVRKIEHIAWLQLDDRASHAFRTSIETS